MFDPPLSAGRIDPSGVPPRVPLVSVGVPTFNRATMLERSLASVLAQDYPAIELVVSDNASTDATENVCRRFASRDPRLQYLRQTFNRGPTENFMEVLRRSRGEYFMWLGDDDWLPDPSYVSKCTGFLIANPDCSLACGVAHYYSGEAFVMDGIQINLDQPSATERVLGFYAGVGDNGTFYGVMRTSQLRQHVLQPVLGGDWLLVAAVAFSGSVRTLQNTSINREYTWDSYNFAKIARQEGLPRICGRFPIIYIALSVLREIAWQSGTYRALNPAQRLVSGLRCSLSVLRRHGLPRLGSRTGAALRRTLPRRLWNLLRTIRRGIRSMRPKTRPTLGE